MIEGHGDDSYKYRHPIRSNFSSNVYNKVNSLSDCTINHIAWNTNVGKLIIVYDNYNIDLIDNSGNVTNLSDYHTKTVNLDKTVNGIYVNGKFAYLYTNFGILKINMGSAEISDTYILNMKITACAIAGGRIYAQTPVGIYGADMSVNLRGSRSIILRSMSSKMSFKLHSTKPRLQSSVVP